uniref:Uncharacterized protein n=1 Tax=Trichogramma kaykai TaxID=54128 RepID=A0ABD2WLS1_9HYME
MFTKSRQSDGLLRNLTSTYRCEFAQLDEDSLQNDRFPRSKTRTTTSPSYRCMMYMYRMYRDADLGRDVYIIHACVHVLMSTDYIEQ